MYRYIDRERDCRIFEYQNEEDKKDKKLKLFNNYSQMKIQKEKE